MNEVHFVVPASIDDPASPSGGNVYDRRVIAGLTGAGWDVREHQVTESGALRERISGLPDGALVLVDGLLVPTAPDALVSHSHRLRLVLLLHMPLEHPQVLTAASAVVTTSEWTRRRLVEDYPVAPARLRVARPGTDAAEVAPRTSQGGGLLCVAAVTPLKGHDVLVDALASLGGLPWTCVCVGALDRDPEFVAGIRERTRAGGVADRLHLAGPRVGTDLETSYARADALVLATRAESYGMVVTEALARGLPVVATGVGGVPEAMGELPDGRRPGLLVPADDPGALAAALRSWLCDGELRSRLRDAAMARRSSLTDWATTTRDIARVLAEVSAA